MKVKSYLNTRDLIEYFIDKTNVSLNRMDILDLVARGLLTPCFRYSGSIAWVTEESSRNKFDNTFFGYLTSHTLQDCYERLLDNGHLTIYSRISIYEALRSTCIPDHLIKDQTKSFYLFDHAGMNRALEKHLVPAANLLDKHGEYAITKFMDHYKFWGESDDLEDILSDNVKLLDHLEKFKVLDPDAVFDQPKEATDFFELDLKASEVIFPHTEITAIIEGKNLQPEKVKEPIIEAVPHPPAEPITTLQAIGIMAELLAEAESGHRFRKSTGNLNIKNIGLAVANRAKTRFGHDIRGFESFNKKISEGLKALEKIEKK